VRWRAEKSRCDDELTRFHAVSFGSFDAAATVITSRSSRLRNSLIHMLDYWVCRIILFRTTKILLYSICWLRERWISNLSLSFFMAKSDEYVTQGKIKSKNSIYEDTGRNLRLPFAKHAWNKLRKTSRCSIARLFNTERVITPWNVAFFCFTRASPEVTQFYGFSLHLYEAG